MKLKLNNSQIVQIITKPAIVCSFISLLFLGKIVQFFLWNPQFYYYWDWPGHIDKAQKLPWIPWQGGWDTTFWGGYPTLTYPSLSHYFIKITTTLTGNLSTGLIIATFITFTLMCYSFYLLSKKFGRTPTNQIIIFCTLILIISQAHGKFLGTYLGTLMGGNLGANLAIAFLGFLVVAKNNYSRAIWLGLLLLTHSLTALVGLIYLLSLPISSLINHHTHRIKESGYLVKDFFITMVFSLAIASPWLIPYIDPAFEGSAINIPLTYFLIPSIFIFLVLLKIFYSKKPIHPILISIFIISLLMFIPQSLIYKPPFTLIQGLHLYRFQLYAIILLSLVMVSWLINPRIFKRRSALFLSITLTIFLLVTQSTPQQDSDIQFDLNPIADFQGRTINVSSKNALLNNQHFLEHVVAHNTTLLGSLGLFYESSQRGLQYYEFANQINPDTLKNGSYIAFFNNIEGQPQHEFDLLHTADLLGINYASYLSVQPPTATSSMTLAGTVDRKGQSDLYIILENIADIALAEPLAQLPQQDSQLDLGYWWLKTDHQQLIVKHDIDTDQYQSLNLNQPQTTINHTSPTSIQLSIDSQEVTPVILKFTHNKYFQAHALDTDSFTSEPHWITPGHILLFAKGNVDLIWQPPKYLLPINILSLLVLAYCLYQTVLLSKSNQRGA